MYCLALWLSLVYLLLLFITPLLSPFTDALLETDLKNSKLPLSLVQALATTALGAFYVRRESIHELISRTIKPISGTILLARVLVRPESAH